MAEEHTGHLVERQDNKRRKFYFGRGVFWSSRSSIVLASIRIQERTRSTTSELEERSQQRPKKDAVHLGGSRGGSY